MLRSDFPGLGISVASMTSAASTASVASMNSTASFHKINYWVFCFHHPWHQKDLSYSLNVKWIIKNPLFYWFLAPFLMKAVEAIPELNLKDKSQMSSPNEYTDNFKSNLIFIWLCHNSVKNPCFTFMQKVRGFVILL